MSAHKIIRRFARSAANGGSTLSKGRGWLFFLFFLPLLLLTAYAGARVVSSLTAPSVAAVADSGLLGDSDGRNARERAMSDFETAARGGLALSGQSVQKRQMPKSVSPAQRFELSACALFSSLLFYIPRECGRPADQPGGTKILREVVLRSVIPVRAGPLC